jgi:hypothetical protein
MPLRNRCGAGKCTSLTSALHSGSSQTRASLVSCAVLQPPDWHTSCAIRTMITLLGMGKGLTEGGLLGGVALVW